MSAPAGTLLHDRRPLGWTDLRVSPISLGTMQFGWLLSHVESMRVLDAYAAAGGNFLDTADMYGADQNLSYAQGKPHVGVSEEIIGRWMRSRGNRGRMVVTTKIRARVWDGPDGEGLSRAHVVPAVDACLRRLQVDTIDLLLAHFPDDGVPLAETMAVMTELQQAGKIRYFGTSNFGAFGRLEELLEVVRRGGYVPVACEQARFSLLHREEFEGPLQATLLREDIGMTCYSPLAAGFLTGKYRRDRPGASPSRAGFVARQYMVEAGWRLLDALAAIAERHHASVAGVALAWILRQPGVTAPVVGANSVAQVAQWADAPSIPLAAEEVERLSSLGWARSEEEFTGW